MTPCALAECNVLVAPNPRVAPDRKRYCSDLHRWRADSRLYHARKREAKRNDRQGMRTRANGAIHSETDCAPCWLYKDRRPGKWDFETCLLGCDGHPIPEEGDPT